MVTVQEAKVIAGQMLVEKYGIDFVLSNKDRIGTSVEYTEEAINVYFDLSEKPIDQYPDLFHANEEEHFPDIFFAVAISVESATPTYLELNDALNR